MYFTLEINESLAEILRTATELYSQLNAYIKNEKKFEPEEYPAIVMSNASDSVGKIITELGDVIGRDIISQAFDEEDRRNNNLNIESHVSE